MQARSIIRTLVVCLYWHSLVHGVSGTFYLVNYDHAYTADSLRPCSFAFVTKVSSIVINIVTSDDIKPCHHLVGGKIIICIRLAKEMCVGVDILNCM